MRKISAIRLVVFAIIVIGLTAAFQHLSGRLPKAAGLRPSLKVMTYSSFMNSWGPGPEIAKLFKERMGTNVEFIDAGDAGLLLKKLELLPADVVIGLDQLSRAQALKARKWRPVSKIAGGLPENRLYAEDTFLAIDWGPMAFIYRKGEVEPPTSLRDLLDPRYKGMLALQDPRTSAPGLQFFFWVLDELGIEEGFRYLERLKGNVQSVSDSWSKAYGAFTKREALLGFSYMTSPVYHWVQEKDSTYQPAIFAEGHPNQIEYLAIPESCESCDVAESFARFLLEPDIQALIMEKNVMFPVIDKVKAGTSFDELPAFQTRAWKNLDELTQRREELLERWRKLGL